jgi:hypothetical protein
VKEAVRPTLNAALRQEIEKAGDDPVRIEDPETHTAYFVLKAEDYDRITPVPGPKDWMIQPVLEGIRRAEEALSAASTGSAPESFGILGLWMTDNPRQ